MAIYIQLGSVAGESTDDKHKDWIEVTSFQWGVSRGITSPTTGGTNREGTVPSVSEITVGKLTPYSLTNVKLINSLGPPQPSAGRQPRPHQPRAAPVPPWLKPVFTRLRRYMRPTGTIELSGFQFDAKELSALAGVPVRDSGDLLK